MSYYIQDKHILNTDDVKKLHQEMDNETSNVYDEVQSYNDMYIVEDKVQTTYDETQRILANTRHTTEAKDVVEVSNI